MLSSEWPILYQMSNGLQDESGAFFIDRDPELFALILHFLRTRQVRLGAVSARDLRLEAEYYAISPLVEKLDICSGRTVCGGILFHSKLDNTRYGPVVDIQGCHNLVAVAHEHNIVCWGFTDSGGWELVAESPTFDEAIQRLAVNVKLGSRGENVVAACLGTQIKLWEFGGRSSEGSVDESGDMPTFDMGVMADSLFFTGNQLVATSQSGKIVVRNSMTKLWQTQEVKPISSRDRAGSLLLLGCIDGSIYSVDLEKFPLRMKDNDLLVNHLYADPSEDAITALSVYVAPSAADQCLEIAYGTESGSVRVIIQVSSHVKI